MCSGPSIGRDYLYALYIYALCICMRSAPAAGMTMVPTMVACSAWHAAWRVGARRATLPGGDPRGEGRVHAQERHAASAVHQRAVRLPLLFAAAAPLVLPNGPTPAGLLVNRAAPGRSLVGPLWCPAAVIHPEAQHLGGWSERAVQLSIYRRYNGLLHLCLNIEPSERPLFREKVLSRAPRRRRRMEQASGDAARPHAFARRRAR